MTSPDLDPMPPRRLPAGRRQLAVGALIVAVGLVGIAILATAPARPGPTPSPNQTSGAPTGSAASPTESVPTYTPEPTPTVDPGSVTAFPTAQGYGRNSPGGRGGRVIYVTSLDNDGPGTLRAALRTKGPRVILFQVAGTIRLRSNIDVTEPFVTLAGQSAPGEGVQIRGAMLRVMTSDVVIRYMRFRPGDEDGRENPADVDGITIHGVNGRVHDVIIDHSTMLWGPDIGGIAMLGDVRDVTVQQSIIGEGLYQSRHPEGIAGSGHSMASNVTQLEKDLPYGRRITFVRNLFTTSNERIPRFQGTGCADVINNVIYDWGERAGHGNPRSLNMVGNLFRAGPDIVARRFWIAQHSDVAPTLFPRAVWLSGNVADGFEIGGIAGDSTVFTNEPVCEPSVEAVDARSILEPILETVGASLPVRDPVDRRIVSNVVERRGGFRNGEGRPAPNPDWPELANGPPADDIDADGMPDSWEMEKFASLDRGNADDSSSDADGDGWTDLEEWLDEADPNQPDQAVQPPG